MSEKEWVILFSNPGKKYFVFLPYSRPFSLSHTHIHRQMRRSDSTYEDLDPEDPVTDLAKVVRQEYRNFLMGTGGDTSEADGSSRLGGLDTLVADLLESPVIQQAITNLVTQVLESPQFKKTCQVLLSELWSDLVNDPETLKQVIHLLQHAIQDEKIKHAAVELVSEVFSDKEVLDELVELVQRLGEEKKVRVYAFPQHAILITFEYISTALEQCRARFESSTVSTL